MKQKFSNKFNFLVRINFILLYFVVGLSFAYAENIHLELADKYALKSKQFYSKAIEEYLLAQKVPGANQKEIYFKLGKLYYQYGDYDRSLEVLSPLYQKSPDDFKIAKIVSFAYFKMGNYTDALSIFEKHEAVKDAEFLYLYGKTCEKQNLYNQAIKVYEKIKDKNYVKKVNKRLGAINNVIKVHNVRDLKDKRLKKIIKNAPGQERYPDAGAVILHDQEKLKILPNGTAIRERYFVVKILNDRGKHYGEIELEYDSTYEKVELEYARTIKSDGTIIQAGEKNIRDVSKYLNFPLYSNARVKIISMPEVAENTIIEYKARWFIGKLIDKKNFCSRYGIQGNEPYLNQYFTLIVPRSYRGKIRVDSVNPGYVLPGLRLRPKVKRDKSREIYTWHFRRIPEIISESHMPPWSEIVANFAFSSFDSWQEIYEWWWGISKDKIDYDNEMKKKVAELIRGRKGKREKAAAIYHFCASKIRYVGVEYGEAGFQPHAATEIFKNKYGDCKDQSILLVSMLKLAGIEAYPVLIGTRGSWLLDEKFPTLSFNHCIAAVKIDGELIFMDSTVETATFGDLPVSDQQRKVLIFYDDHYELSQTPLFKPERDLIKYALEIKVLPDESIFGERTVCTKGNYSMGLRNLKYTKPILRKEMLKKRVNEICPGGKLITYKISDLENLETPVKIEMKFSGPKYLKKSGSTYLVPQLGGLSTGFISKATRIYPLDFGSLDAKKSLVEIELPPDYEVKYLPESIQKENICFKYKNTYKYENNRIYFYEEKLIKKTLLSINKYKNFKSFYEKLARDIDKQIVLEKK